MSWSVTASTEPCTSAFTTRGSSWSWPSAMARPRSSSLIFDDGDIAFSRSLSWRKATMDCAFRLSVTTRSWSPGSGSAGRPRISTGVDGPALLQPLAVVVDEGADLARHRARHDGVADAQGAVLDEDGGHGAAALVEPRLEHGADGRLLGVGLQLLQVGHQQQHLEELLEVLLLLGRDVHEDGGAAPFLGHQPAVGELLLDAVGLGVRLVDLVHRHHDGHAGRLGVVHGLDRLRHHAVVGGHHQDDDVRDLGPAGAHEGEGLVAGGVEEDDLPRCPRRRGRRRCAG